MDVTIRAGSLALIVGLSWIIPAIADGPPRSMPAPAAGPVELPSQWSFRFTVYGWLPWFNGDAAVRGRKLDVDATPSQLLGHLDWSSIPAWMSYAEARRGPLSLFNDIVYAKVTDAGHFARIANRQFLTAGVSGAVDVDATLAIIEAGAAYQVWSAPGTVLPGTSALDVVAGARYWHQEVDLSVALGGALTLNGPLGIGDLTRSRDRLVARSGSVDWVDPFVGLRFRQQLMPGHELMLRGDVGGFGVGSDFTWQVIATYDFQMCTCSGYVVDGYLGYRALSVDYEQGSGNNKYVYDVLQHGPVLGVTVRF